MSEDSISIGRNGNGSEIEQEDIPDDWSLLKVGEVSEVNSNPKSDETDVPYLPMDALDTEMPSPKYTERRNPKENSGTMFKQQDTLFAKITPSTENGKSAYMDEIDTSVGIATTEVITLSPKETHPLYLYYYANSHPSKEYAVSRMRGTSGRQRVPKSVFERELKIPLPNRQEQRRIASVLYSVDEQLRTLTDRHDRLSELKHGLMQDLLTGETRVTPEIEVHNNIPETDSEPELKKEDTRTLIQIGANEYEFPSSWSGTELKESLKLSRGLNYESDGYREEGDGRPFITLKALNKGGGIDWSGMKYYTDDGLTDNTAEFGDILIANTDLTQDGDIVGYPVHVKIEDFDSEPYYSHHLYNLGQSEEFCNYFLDYLLRADYIHSAMKSFSAGSTVLNLNSTLVKNMVLPTPPLWEQERIASVLYTVDEMIARTSDLIDEYEQLKRGLMQDLLSGDVRTPETLEVLNKVNNE